jgi:hypothetical protein
MDYEFMFIFLCVFNATLFIVCILQMRENGKLSAKVQSLGLNQDDAFKEIDQLAIKMQAIHADVYKALLRPPVVKQAQTARRGRPVGSKNKTKEGAKK